MLCPTAVYADGQICLDILQNRWSPTYNVGGILASIQSLLDEPNPNSPANAEASVWETTQCNISMENAGDDSQIFTDTCIVDPDGSIDRCGGHFPCAANKAMTVKGHLIYGFNGEGWNGAQANQWLHYDAITGLFLGQFGTVNGIHESKYSDDGWAAPGAAGNAFSCTLVTTTSGDVYLYHNDESAHGGVHRWHLHGLDDVERVRIALAT